MKDGDNPSIGTLIKKFINITNDLVYFAVRRVCKRVRRSKKILTRYGCNDFLFLIYIYIYIIMIIKNKLKLKIIIKLLIYTFYEIVLTKYKIHEFDYLHWNVKKYIS